VIAIYQPERALIGEVFGSLENQKLFLGENLDGLNLAFLWELLDIKAKAGFLRKVIKSYEYNYPAPFTPVYVFGNHDRKRLISSLSGDTNAAKLLAIFQFSVRGVPVTYYGEEIGMADGNFPAKDALDPIGQRFAAIPQFLIDLLGIYINRDSCRTPMQWDSSPNAGFCEADARPWLPTHPNRAKVNVKSQLNQEDSLLNLYRKLLHIRKQSPVLQTGTMELIDDPRINENILLYKRVYEEQCVLAALNFSPKPVRFHNPTQCAQPLLAVGTYTQDSAGTIQLSPWAGVILASGTLDRSGKIEP